MKNLFQKKWLPLILPALSLFDLTAQTTADTVDLGLSEINYYAAKTSDNGYVTVGYQDSNGMALPYVGKLDENGNLSWKKPSNANGYNIKTNVALTNDDQILIPGEKINGMTETDLNLVSRSMNGEILWEKNLPRPGPQEASLVFSTTNHGFVVMGTAYSSQSTASDSVLLWGLDGSGNPVWNKVLAPPDPGAQVFPTGMKEVPSTGELYIAWSYNTDSNPWKGMLTKLNIAREVVWEKQFIKPSAHYFLADLDVISADTLVVCGLWGSDVFIQAIDAQGDDLWFTGFARPGTHPWLNDLAVAGNKIGAAGDASGLFYVQTDFSGNVQMDTAFGTGMFYSIEKVGAGFLISGSTTVADQKDIILLNVPGLLSSKAEGLQPESSTVMIFPNPAQTEITVDLPSDQDVDIEIFGSAGQNVLSVRNRLRVDISALNAGVYFLAAKQGSRYYSGKFVKE